MAERPRDACCSTDIGYSIVDTVTNLSLVGLQLVIVLYTTQHDYGHRYGDVRSRAVKVSS